jgi:hypothetical protein
LTSKKVSREAIPDQAQSRRNRGKTVRRSLVKASEAQEAALLARELRTSQTQQELAVIVVVEFTGELRKRRVTAGARLARTAASVMAEEKNLPSIEASAVDLDASRAEFEELARSAGATIAATVGFIRNLPHTLVTSFRATLEEVERAEILLHVQDASSPMREEQKIQVKKVLAELGVSAKPVIQVLNKTDLVPLRELAHLSRDREAIPVSSLQRTGLDQLLKAVDVALVVDPLVESSFRLPQSEGSILAALERDAIINEKRFEGNLVFFRARGPASLLDRYCRFREKHHLS